VSKLFWLTAFALAGVYVTGYLSLSESSANAFLNSWEKLSLDGNAHAQCELLTDDFEVSIKDHTTPRDAHIEGGKEDFCAHIKTISAAMALLQPTTNVRRENFTATRSFAHPWTADVSYTEFRSTSIPRAGIQQNTESEDKLVLVKTFGGVKIQRLESEAWLADE